MNIFWLKKDTLMTPLTFSALDGFSHKDKDRDKFIENAFQNQESVAMEADNKHFSKKRKTLVTLLGDLFMKSSLTNEPLNDSV